VFCKLRELLLQFSFVFREYHGEVEPAIFSQVTCAEGIVQLGFDLCRKVKKSSAIVRLIPSFFGSGVPE